MTKVHQKCSKYSFRKMQIKATHPHAIVAKRKKKFPLTSVGDDMEYTILSYVTGRIRNGTAILQNFLLVTCEVKYIQLYKPEISLLGIHPKEMKTYFYKRL